MDVILNILLSIVFLLLFLCSFAALFGLAFFLLDKRYDKEIERRGKSDPFEYDWSDPRHPMYPLKNPDEEEIAPPKASTYDDFSEYE